MPTTVIYYAIEISYTILLTSYCLHLCDWPYFCDCYLHFCCCYMPFRLSQHIQLSIIDFAADIGHMGSPDVGDTSAKAAR